MQNGCSKLYKKMIFIGSDDMLAKKGDVKEVSVEVVGRGLSQIMG